MASTSNVPILPVFVLVLWLYHCTVCTVLVSLVKCSGMASTGNVPIFPRLYSYCACTVAQCVLCLYPLYSDSAWPARAMYIFCPCLYSYCGCTISQCVLVLVPPVQCSVMANTGNVPILSMLVLVMCEYHCTVCTVRVPPVQWFSRAARVMYRNFPCLLVLCVYHCTVCIVLVPLVHVCVCVFFPFILDIKFTGRTSRGHTGFFAHLLSAVRAFLSLPFPRRP